MAAVARPPLVVAAVLSLFAAGCAPVGRNYARPIVQTPAAFRFIEGAAQGESLADMPWWQVFDDPNLQALIREAIANNLDVRVAVARVEEARAQARVAKSFLYPQVDATGSHSVQQNTGDHPDDEVHHTGTYG